MVIFDKEEMKELTGKNKKKKKKIDRVWWLILAILFCPILIPFVLYFLFKDKDDSYLNTNNSNNTFNNTSNINNTNNNTDSNNGCLTEEEMLYFYYDD